MANAPTYRRTNGVYDALRSSQRLFVRLAVMRIDAEIVFLEYQNGIAYRSVQNQNAFRVKSFPHIPRFKMQMRSRTRPVLPPRPMTSPALQSAGINQKARQMTVIRFQPVGMPDNQQISIPAGIACHFLYPYHSVKSRSYGISCRQGNVCPPVLPHPSERIPGAYFIGNGHTSLHQRIGKRHDGLFREVFQRDLFESMNGGSVPAFVHLFFVKYRFPKSRNFM